MEMYFEQLFALLNVRDNHLIIMVVYLGCAALAVLLRVITCVTYRSRLLTLRLSAKDIRAWDEVAKIHSGLLRNLAAEYKRVADKNVSRVPTEALVNRQVDTFSFLGWRFTGIMPLVESLEGGLLWVGLILALLFTDYAMMYGVLAVGGFLLFRLAVAFFDFRTARAALTADLLVYVEREIGQFFAADMGGAVLRLKNELKDSLTRQTAVLQESVDKIGASLAAAVDKKLTGINGTVSESMKDWEKTLTSAAESQTALNETAERLRTAAEQIFAASHALAAHFQSYNDVFSGQLGALVAATDHFSAEQAAFLTQAQFIERNQHILESTYQSYEASLQNLTQSLGEGLGAYLKLHAQTASQAINEALTAQIAAGFRPLPPDVSPPNNGAGHD